MSPGSGSLLRALAGGVRPVDAPVSAAASSPPDRDTLDFQGLLDRARQGELRTGLPLALPVSLRGGIDRATGERLSAAADDAAAMGIDRALVLIGEHAYRVDVRARAVIDAPPEDQHAITGVDGVVRVPSPHDPAAGAPTPSPAHGPAAGPARVVRNTSLLETLAGQHPG